MKIKHQPETNSLGLVIPPSPETISFLSINKPAKVPDRINRHHLYWPKNYYHQNKLATSFREHRFNSVWLLKSVHQDIHDNYDGVPYPSKEVMEVYLQEATILDELGVCIKAIEMINEAIYEDRVKHERSTNEHKSQRLNLVSQNIAKVNHFEALPREVVAITLSRAQSLLDVA